MQDRRSDHSRLMNPPFDRSERIAGWLSAIGRASIGAAASLSVGAIMVLALPGLAEAQAGSPLVTFCDQAGCIPQGGPTSSSAEQISGGAQRQIEQRLQRLRCEGSDDPACAGVGGAAADEVSYEGLGIFFSAGYQRKDKTPTAFELGFESDSVGPTIGADYRIGSDIVVGAAFDYRHAFGEYDDNFGDFDTDTYTLLLFGSYYPTDQSFIDAALGFGYKQFDTEHLNNGGGGNVRGNTTGFDFTADLTGGYDFSFGALTVGPRLGVHYKRAQLNGFTETGAAPLTTYRDQVDDSLTGTVGAQASYAFSTSFGVVVPTVNAEYVREFLDDRERYTASVGAGAPFSFSGDQPDRNHFNVGGGVVVLLPNGVFPFINYEAEIANYLQETHTVTGGVRLEF